MTNWATKALIECVNVCYSQKGYINSSYTRELMCFLTNYNIGFIRKDNKNPEINIKRAIEEKEQKENVHELKKKSEYTLKYMPKYADTIGRQKYIHLSEAAAAIAKFRLGNSGLGNRTNPNILRCFCCYLGPNCELQLVF